MVTTAPSWDNNYGRTPHIFFVPDEICFTATGSPAETGHARHLRLRDAHNAHLKDLVNRANDRHELARMLTPTPSLYADLTPSHETFAFLQAKAQENTGVLHATSAPPGSTPGPVRPQWVHLPASHPASTTATTTLHRFTVGDREDHTHPVETRTRRVRDLILLWNLLFRQQGITTRAVPNWLVSASGMPCPGPGSAPVWIPPDDLPAGKGYWSFAFPHEKVAAVVKRGRETPSSVVVAVLDTSPTAAAVKAAAHDPRHAHNLLLHHVAESPRVTIDHQLPHPIHDLSHLKNMLGNWRDRETDAAGNPLPDETFRMDDHGLFITGIIHDIAPHADVHLIRVMTGYGVTDSHAAIEALAQLPQLLTDDAQRLIINMSLGFSIPPGVEALRFLMHDTYARLEAEFGPTLTLDAALARLETDDPATHAALVQILEDLHAGLREIVDWLAAHPQVLMVAAAGNDNRFFGPRTTRPEPRWPARYDEVLGVAAVNGARKPTPYSNRGDVNIMGNGVATFGGDTTNTADGDLGAIDTTRTPVDAVAGIYSAEALTLGTGPNDTGWVYWSGTSFSTPVITALAANLWDMRLDERRDDPTLPDYGPQELIAEMVTTFFSDPPDTTAPDSLGTPTIAAAQVWVSHWQG